MISDEEKIIRGFLSGSEPAFEALLRMYLKPIYNFLYRLVRDHFVAEDLAQEAFLKAWENRKRFKADKKIKTWLFTIAKNTAYDWLRKKKELPFSRFADVEGNNVLENIAGEESLPDEILERKNISEDLENVLQKLPPHYRAILILHYKEDFSLHEIAEILDEPYNTIKSRHQRGLARFKKELLQS